MPRLGRVCSAGCLRNRFWNGLSGCLAMDSSLHVTCLHARVVAIDLAAVCSIGAWLLLLAWGSLWCCHSVHSFLALRCPRGLWAGRARAQVCVAGGGFTPTSHGESYVCTYLQAASKVPRVCAAYQWLARYGLAALCYGLPGGFALHAYCMLLRAPAHVSLLRGGWVVGRT